MTDAKQVGQWLRATFAAPIDNALDETFAKLGASDPVLASIRGRISDGGDTDDPLVEDLARRVEAAGS